MGFVNGVYYYNKNGVCLSCQSWLLNWGSQNVYYKTWDYCRVYYKIRFVSVFLIITWVYLSVFATEMGVVNLFIIKWGY